MTLPILYTFRRCPYAMRTRMALAHAGIRYELREVVLKNKPPSMLELSPKAEVPVLKLADEVIDESIDIMRWALPEGDDWLNYGAEELMQMDDLVARCESDFKLWLDRYKYADRHSEFTQEFSREQGEWFLQELETRLGQQTYLFGERLSFADVALMPFVRQFAHVDIKWFETSKYVRLCRWLESLKASELFLSVMKKYPQWHDGDEVTVFEPEGWTGC